MATTGSLTLAGLQVRWKTLVGVANVTSAFDHRGAEVFEGLDAPYLHATQLLVAARVLLAGTRGISAVVDWRRQRRRLLSKEWDAGAAVRIVGVEWWRLDYCMVALREGDKSALTREMCSALVVGDADAAQAAVLRYARTNPAELMRAVPLNQRKLTTALRSLRAHAEQTLRGLGGVVRALLGGTQPSSDTLAAATRAHRAQEALSVLSAVARTVPDQRDERTDDDWRGVGYDPRVMQQQPDAARGLQELLAQARPQRPEVCLLRDALAMHREWLDPLIADTRLRALTQGQLQKALQGLTLEPSTLLAYFSDLSRNDWTHVVQPAFAHLSEILGVELLPPHHQLREYFNDLMKDLKIFTRGENLEHAWVKAWAAVLPSNILQRELREPDRRAAMRLAKMFDTYLVLPAVIMIDARNVAPKFDVTCWGLKLLAYSRLCMSRKNFMLLALQMGKDDWRNCMRLAEVICRDLAELSDPGRSEVTDPSTGKSVLLDLYGCLDGAALRSLLNTSGAGSGHPIPYNDMTTEQSRDPSLYGPLQWTTESSFQMEEEYLRSLDRHDSRGGNRLADSDTRRADFAKCHGGVRGRVLIDTISFERMINDPWHLAARVVARELSCLSTLAGLYGTQDKLAKHLRECHNLRVFVQDFGSTGYNKVVLSNGTQVEKFIDRLRVGERPLLDTSQCTCDTILPPEVRELVEAHSRMLVRIYDCLITRDMIAYSKLLGRGANFDAYVAAFARKGNALFGEHFISPSIRILMDILPHQMRALVNDWGLPISAVNTVVLEAENCEQNHLTKLGAYRRTDASLKRSIQLFYYMRSTRDATARHNTLLAQNTRLRTVAAGTQPQFYLGEGETGDIGPTIAEAELARSKQASNAEQADELPPHEDVRATTAMFFGRGEGEGEGEGLMEDAAAARGDAADGDEGDGGREPDEAAMEEQAAREMARSEQEDAESRELADADAEELAEERNDAPAMAAESIAFAQSRMCARGEANAAEEAAAREARAKLPRSITLKGPITLQVGKFVGMTKEAALLVDDEEEEEEEGEEGVADAQGEVAGAEGGGGGGEGGGAGTGAGEGEGATADGGDAEERLVGSDLIVTIGFRSGKLKYRFTVDTMEYEAVTSIDCLIGMSVDVPVELGDRHAQSEEGYAHPGRVVVRFDVAEAPTLKSRSDSKAKWIGVVAHGGRGDDASARLLRAFTDNATRHELLLDGPRFEGAAAASAQHFVTLMDAIPSLRKNRASDEPLLLYDTSKLSEKRKASCLAMPIHSAHNEGTDSQSWNDLMSELDGIDEQLNQGPGAFTVTCRCGTQLNLFARLFHVKCTVARPPARDEAEGIMEEGDAEVGIAEGAEAAEAVAQEPPGSLSEAAAAIKTVVDAAVWADAEAALRVRRTRFDSLQAQGPGPSVEDRKTLLKEVVTDGARVYPARANPAWCKGTTGGLGVLPYTRGQCFATIKQMKAASGAPLHGVTQVDTKKRMLRAHCVAAYVALQAPELLVGTGNRGVDVSVTGIASILYSADWIERDARSLQRGG